MSIIVGITLLDYAMGLLIDRAQSQVSKFRYLVTSLVANLGLLFAFKYYGLTQATLGQFSRFFGFPLLLPHLDIVLPLGISFHTFQTMSYNIDIYKGKIKPEQKLINFALFVAFFPQMIAGPIERAEKFLPQIDRIKKLSWKRITISIEWILVGLVKKVVIADRLSLLVDRIFSNVAESSSNAVLAAVLFFGIQIYCDFCGYTDIARGAAGLLGFDLTINFNFPYFANSFRDFWRRWHISLSTWFRDYVYISLGGNRGGLLRQIAILVLVFFLSGLWHGARWNFAVWGLLHGAFLAAEVCIFGNKKITFWMAFVTRPVTLLGVFAAWILFRAGSFADAMKAFHKLMYFNWQPLHPDLSGYWYRGVGVLLLFIVLEAVLYLRQKFETEKFGPFESILTGGIWGLLLITIIMFGYDGESNFIYFQF